MSWGAPPPLIRKHEEGHISRLLEFDEGNGVEMIF